MPLPHRLTTLSTLLLLAASVLPALAAGKGKSKPSPEAVAITKARADLAKATKSLNDATTKALADFESTPEVTAAKTALASATAAAQDARAAVLAKLASVPAYKSAQSAEAAAKKELDSLIAAKSAADVTAAQSEEVLKLGNVTSKIEIGTLAIDPAYLDAQKKLAAATSALSDLRFKFRESLATSPILERPRQARETAQEKLAALEGKTTPTPPAAKPPTSSTTAPTTAPAAQKPTP